MKETLRFKLEKETKNTLKFAEDAPVPVIGALYVQKHAWRDGNFPKEIVVTVTDEVSGS